MEAVDDVVRDGIAGMATSLGLHRSLVLESSESLRLADLHFQRELMPGELCMLLASLTYFPQNIICSEG